MAIAAVGFVIVITMFVALMRIQKHTKKAKEGSKKAQIQLMMDAEQLRKQAEAARSPEREARKARVAAAWGSSTQTRPAAPVDSTFLPGVTPPAGEPIPMPAPLLSSDAPTAMPGTASDEVDAALTDLADRLRVVAGKVDALTGSRESGQSKADQALVLLAREWAALPLNDLNR